MASSLLSLALDQPLDPTVAMTGELTLTGKILRIGGLREKTVAARRAGAKSIIFPADNRSDWLELPEVFKSDMSIIPQGPVLTGGWLYRTSKKAFKATRRAGTPMSLTWYSPTWISKQPIKDGKASSRKQYQRRQK